MKALTGKEMVALLEKHGWHIVKIRGSHCIIPEYALKNHKITQDYHKTSQ